MKRMLVGSVVAALLATCYAGESWAQEKKQESARQKESGKKAARSGRRRGQRRPDNAPRVGDLAPLFTLKSLDGQSETDLGSFRGEKPVVLFFGSYT